MLIGNWKNIDELEDCLNLNELKLILDSYRDKELRNQKFQAAIRGIDLDKQIAKQAEDSFKKVQDRVQARLAGMSEKQFEINELGFDLEEEEEELPPTS